MASMSPINFDRVGDKAYTSHHNSNPLHMETHLKHNFFQTTPLNLIINLTHMKFHHYLSNLPRSLLIDMVHCFKSNQYIISNKTFRHKSTLILTNNVWKKTF